MQQLYVGRWDAWRQFLPRDVFYGPFWFLSAPESPIGFVAVMQRGIRVRRRRVSHVAVVVLWLRAQGEAVAFMGGFGHSEEHGQARSLEEVCKSVNEFW